VYIRVTKSVATPPSDAEVRTRMQEIQCVIEEGSYAPEEVYNADETGFQLNASIHYQYMLNGVRAEVENNHDKSRITAMLGSNSCGEFVPTMFIMKCSTKNADQSRTSTLEHLLATPEFSSGDWEIRMWDKTLSTSLCFYNILFILYYNSVYRYSATQWQVY
jgi:hypothetical protein